MADVTTLCPEAIAHVRMSKTEFETFRDESGIEFTTDHAQRENVAGSMRFGALSHEPWWEAPELGEEILFAYTLQPSKDPEQPSEARLVSLVALNPPRHADIYLYYING